MSVSHRAAKVTKGELKTQFLKVRGPGRRLGGRGRGRSCRFPFQARWPSLIAFLRCAYIITRTEINKN